MPYNIRIPKDQGFILMVIIKRYPNRKLYNTEQKQYITLDGITELIRAGTEIKVIDNASGEDLTALTLTQIILEEEKRQSGLLSNSILTGLIRASGDRLSSLQQSLSSSFSAWRQIDDEIRQRIQGLVHRGELTDNEGHTLLEQLIEQGTRLREERHIPQPGKDITSENVEAILSERQVPTRADIKRLYEQLDLLNSKLEGLTSAPPSEGE
jgi:polyhydroxyalkanoate synthesis repressor PhaR